jgi:alpha-1,3-mannosyltransferase
VIHAHGYHISISFISFLITRIKKKKFILTAHDLRIPDSYPITAKIFSYIYDHSFGKLMILKSDKLIALTEDDYDFYKNLGAKEKNIVIIPNGIDIKKYFSDVDISSPILLYVGRIVDYKGIDKIIYLLPLLKKKYYNIKLYIVGNDYGYQSYVEELIDILKIKEHVYIFNNISQEKLIQLYKKSNIFVFPSQLEGFGIVLLEAMASRTLCIAYNIPGVRKVIKNDYGILVDTDSDLLLNISYYLNPDNFNEKLLILNKAQKYVKKYDISFIIESYVDLYEKI